MKLTLDKSWKHHIAGLSAFAPTRTTLPVLNNVRITANGEQVTAMATDLENWMRVSRHVDEGAKGELLIPSKILSHAIGLAEDGLTIERQKSGKVVMRSGSSTYTVGSQDPSGYPPPPAIEDCPAITMDAAAFHDAIRALAPCCNETNHTRYMLEGIWFYSEGGDLKLMASNGKIAGSLTIGESEPIQAAVHAKSMLMLASVLPDEGSVAVKIGSKMVAVRLPDGSASFRRMECDGFGKTLSQFFATSAHEMADATEYTMPKEGAIQALSECAAIADGDIKPLQIKIAGDKATFSVPSQLMGGDFTREIETAGNEEGHIKLGLILAKKFFQLLPWPSGVVRIEKGNQTKVYHASEGRQAVLAAMRE